MTTCPAHRPRLRRLWQLPTVRTVGAAGAATVVLAAAAALAWPWVSAAVLAAGAAGIAGHVHRNCGRVAVERRMLRALKDSAPRCPEDIEVPTLTAPVRAECGDDGVTRITAQTYHDAVRALGYTMARDRGFQLDLVRRTGSGRVAEVWGRTAVPLDTAYRRLGLAAAARAATERLAGPERDLLTAFADGVNAAFAQQTPFECRFLSYRPQPWQVEDSVLTALVLSHSLSWNEEAKRAESVMRRALPGPVADFFLPGGTTSLPTGLAHHRGQEQSPDLVALDGAVPGSNCWIATGDEPLLACDLHLAFGVPNVLYEIDLAWPGTRLRGLASPGLPVALTGTNGRIVWGVTNLTADVLDLVPAGRDTLHTRTEQIRVRGRRPVTVEITTDGTMPVSQTPLCGEKIAVRWTGHDPRAADLRFHRLAHAHDVDEAVRVLDDAHGVALNVLVADRKRMAHLATGLLPRRPAGTPRTEPADGHLTGPERPRAVDPADGILVSANDAALPEDEFRIGLDLDPGHRARRIRDVLGAAERHDAAGMHALQHDIAADLYLHYRDLAVAALRPGDPVRTLLQEWDGTASTGSRAFGVLVRLRNVLARRVLAPYVAVCREYEPAFRFPFRDLDRPLRAILDARDCALLPAGTTDVDGFIAECVAAAVRERPRRWGRLNRVGLSHPLAALVPWADPVLGIRPRSQAGMLHSVRTAVPGFGAAGRIVATVDDLVTAELPAGQSGHPLSPHYADRHARWASLAPPRTRPRRTGCGHVLRPPAGR
ncbi:penicillin acylase family protein [Streptomyces sp. TRM S81-3]|uniref:Penicillin acylase family protein n=1 Tax=Streptomyces griseicoloratus TaxID=2752516 RepID=A0A926L226_9ACTN|nr:penicillin acylase family protein [Streptomyces griseicoloratus]MBD0420470.1 penicillin acylase family protein [Streptomyces griseicoloratus]